MARGFRRTRGGDVLDKLSQLLERQKKLERELEALKAKAASGATSDLASQAQDVDGIKVLAARLEGFDAKALRDAVDRLKQQLGDAVIVLAGDTHNAWHSELKNAAGEPVATELATASVSSP